MSDFETCVLRAEAAGEIDPIRGAKARATYKRHYDRQKKRGLDDAAAIHQAELDAKAELAREARNRKWREIRQIHAYARLKENATTYRNGAGEVDPAKALVAHLERDHLNRFESVVGTQQGLEADYQGRFADAIRAFAPSLLGKRPQPALMSDMLDVIHGGKATPEAKALADAWRSASERARLDFNAAGGSIAEMANWGLPHNHDRTRIEGKFDAWSKDVYAGAAWDRIENHETGRPFSADGWPSYEETKPFLQKVYQQIVSNGWANRKPSGQTHGSSLATSRAEHRVLHMKDGRAWEAYNAKYGSHDPMTTMVLHLKAMARDTALMRVYGPNPRAGAAFLHQTALKMAYMGEAARPGAIKRGMGGTAVSRVENNAAFAQRMMDEYEGASMTPADQEIATWFASGRQLMVAAQLGGATLSAVPTDILNVVAHSRAIGGSGMRATKHLVQLYAGERKLAQRMGLIMDHMVGVGAAEARFVGQVWTPEKAALASEIVMRASFLTQTTSLHRHVFQLEFMGALADNVGKPFAEIHKALKRRLELHGISAADWEKIRKTELLYKGEDTGDGFLRPRDIEDRDLSIRMQGIMAEEMEIAIPSATLRGRVQLRGGSAPGTVAGEVALSGAMYKNFSFSIYYNHILRRYYERPSGKGFRHALMANLKWATLMAIGGAISIQMKEIAKGRDPREMNDPKFVVAALLQGGGLGLFGDFLASTENRFGGGWAQSLAGPMVGFGYDLGSLTMGNVIQAAKGEDTNFGRELTRFVRRYGPGGSIWWGALAWNRLVLDELQEALDPEAAAAWSAAERKRAREYGNAAWWAPGESAPSRAPDPSAAIGG